MPILDLQLVGDVPDGVAQRVADAAAHVLNMPPQRVWVRVTALLQYAENGGRDESLRPVFVKVLKRDAPEDALGEARELTIAIAEACGWPAENVHVIYEPPAAGRAAFGGDLLDP